MIVKFMVKYLESPGGENVEGKRTPELRQWEQIRGMQWRAQETKTLTFKRETLLYRASSHQTNANPSSLFVAPPPLSLRFAPMLVVRSRGSNLYKNTFRTARACALCTLFDFTPLPWSFASFCNSSGTRRQSLMNHGAAWRSRDRSERIFRCSTSIQFL